MRGFQPVATSALLCFFLVLTTSSPAQTSSKPDSKLAHGREFLGLAAAADPVAADRGQKVFSQNCAFCHGQNATGAEGPDLLRSTVVLHDEKGETIAPVILKGRPDKGMPSFPSFSEAQIYDVAEFLHQRVEQAANRWGYKVQNVVTGNAEAGKSFFNGAGHCNTCHSPSGDLAHIASKFTPADLQVQFLYPSASSGANDSKAHLLPKVTVKLPSGESSMGTLKSMDDFDISLVNESGDVKTFSREGNQVKIEDPLAAHRELLAKYSDADMHNMLAYLVTLK